MTISYQFKEDISIHWLVQKLPDFLFPDLSLQIGRIKQKFWVILAIHDRLPVGLLLANAHTDLKTYRIHSFYVHPNFRNKGVGGTLIKNIEKAISQREGKKIELIFNQHWKANSFLNKILSKQGWQPPKPFLILIKGSIALAWSQFNRKVNLKDYFAFIPFSQLTTQEASFIINKQNQETWFDPDLNPFLQKESIDLNGSFFVKKEKEIIAWIVVHRLKPNLCEISSLFISEENRFYTLAYALIQRALEQQRKVGVLDFIATSKLNGNPIAKMMKRKATKIGLFTTVSLYACKNL